MCGSTLCHTGIKYQLWCHSCFYINALLRSGKCREEKTWGKTENGSEKPHQINRGMENKVSHRVTRCDSLVPLLTVLIIACLLSCPTKYAFPSIALEKDCCTWPKVWFKFLPLVFSGVKCCTTAPPSGQNVQLQLCHWTHWSGHWCWCLIPFGVNKYSVMQCVCVSCCFACLLSAIFIQSCCFKSAGGFSKAPTLTIKLRTGSTWKATGTGTTLTCLTSTNNSKYTQISHTHKSYWYHIWILPAELGFVLGLRSTKWQSLALGS